MPGLYSPGEILLSTRQPRQPGCYDKNISFIKSLFVKRKIILIPAFIFQKIYCHAYIYYK